MNMKKTFTLLLGCLFSSAYFAQTKQAASATQMQNPSFVRPALRTATAPLSTLALSGYYTQDFEGTAFPPAGWQVQNVAGATYTWARSTAQAHQGLASAFIRYDASGGEDWLIAPKFQVTAATDSVVFYLRLAFQGYPPDSLSLKLSTTDSARASFTTTLLALHEGVNYPPNSNAWYRYAVSLGAYSGQQVFIAFKHYDNDGDGLYIDDVSIGTPPAAEIKAQALTIPSYTGVMTTVIPQATFLNNGSAAQTFDVTTTISPGGYTSTQTVTALAPGANFNASFASWVPSTPGTYTVTAYSQLAGDINTLNDTLVRSVTVLSSFANGGWSAQAPLAAGRWATAPAFAKPCISGTDTAYVYLISGGDAAFANSAANSAYNLTTGTWSDKAPIPASRTQVTPLQVKNKIYVIGGYAGSFSPVTTNSIYDILTDTWSTGAPLPQATGDYAAAVYNDSLIYIIGGYSGTADLSNVQVYNVNTDTWASGTAKTGTAVSGGRMGITGNTIIHTGGYNQVMSANIADALMGTIDPANPLVITWSSIANYPGGTASRLGAGTTAQPNGEVYFGGGDPDGEGIAVRNTVYAYNTLSNAWEIGPVMTGVSNISGFAGVIYQDTLYMVSVGGYDGTNVVSTNQWLKIGPAAVPSAGSDVAVCAGTPASISASGGTGYSWSPATGLDNAAIAAPAATPAATTTYTVTISQHYGCDVQKTVTVTVNPIPVADAGSNTAICSGSNTMLNATGGTIYSWSPAASLNDSTTASPTATPSSTTTYTVVVADTNSCSSSATVMVTVNDLPVTLASFSNVTCNGLANGTAGVSVAGGMGSYSYAWSTSDTTATIDSLAAGTYSYTVTNNSTGCFVTGSIGITEPDSLLLSVTSDTVGFGDCNGTVAVTATGGTPSYTYMWSPGGEITDVITNLCAGNYSVTVTDANGCNTVATTTVQSSVSVHELPASAFSSYPNPAGESLTITGHFSNTTITLVNVLGEQVMLIAEHLNGSRSETINISALPAGAYFLQLKNEEGITTKRIIKK